MNLVLDKIDTIDTEDNHALQLTSQEWIETNQLGAYSSSTILNCHTRKYHGLLTKSKPSGLERIVLLSKLDEQVNINDEKYYLSFHYYLPNIFVPNSEKNILDQEFSQLANPIWKYSNDKIEVIKELMLSNDQNTLLIKYEFSTKNKNDNSKLEIRPLIANRSFHALQKENPFFDNQFYLDGDNLRCHPYRDGENLFCKISIDNSSFEASPCWYKDFSYTEEQQRGYDSVEDLASPGKFTIDLNTTKILYIAFSDKHIETRPEELWRLESKYRSQYSNFGFGLGKNKTIYKLDKAAKDFVINIDAQRSTITAGYHWFGSWGRDTMISLPGIFLKTKWQNDFIKVFRYFTEFMQDGLLPNMVGSSTANSAYNSVDASLWMFWAMQKFAEELKDIKWIKNEFWDKLKSVITHYASGVSNKVKCHENGLLYTGSENDSLSWMDACVFKDPILNDLKSIKKLIEINFEDTFYVFEKGYLADYVRDGAQNIQLRPNQLFAISLPYTCISEDLANRIIEVTTDELLTPKGLRTLAPSDLNYKGIYEGDQDTRDRAYHNGTVWPWLLGAYCDSLLKYQKTSAKKNIMNIISNFEKELDIGSVAEIYDGDKPFKSRGCIAQAWSVAELRRALLAIS